eukprot:jgi/Bigna1/126209/aug1.2_g917
MDPDDDCKDIRLENKIGPSKPTYTYAEYVDHLRGVGVRQFQLALSGITKRVKRRKGLQRRGRGRKNKKPTASGVLKTGTGTMLSGSKRLIRMNTEGGSKTELKTSASPKLHEVKEATSHTENTENELSRWETFEDPMIPIDILKKEKLIADGTPVGSFDTTSQWIRKNIASKQWFENIILMMILINCILLAFQNPLKFK